LLLQLLWIGEMSIPALVIYVLSCTSNRTIIAITDIAEIASFLRKSEEEKFLFLSAKKKQV